MQLNSPTMGLYACEVLLPVQDSIPVAVDTLVEEDILAVVDIPVVVEGNQDSPVAEGNLEEDSLVVAHTLAVDTLEVAFAALLCRIVIAHADQDCSRAFLLVVVQVMVFLLAALQAVFLLLVVRLAVPGCPCVSPPILTSVSYLQENFDWHGFHKQ
jgi:hypothetical protein